MTARAPVYRLLSIRRVLGIGDQYPIQSAVRGLCWIDTNYPGDRVIAGDMYRRACTRAEISLAKRWGIV